MGSEKWCDIVDGLIRLFRMQGPAIKIVLAFLLLGIVIYACRSRQIRGRHKRYGLLLCKAEIFFIIPWGLSGIVLGLDKFSSFSNDEGGLAILSVLLFLIEFICILIGTIYSIKEFGVFFLPAVITRFFSGLIVYIPIAIIIYILSAVMGASIAALMLMGVFCTGELVCIIRIGNVIYFIYLDD